MCGIVSVCFKNNIPLFVALYQKASFKSHRELCVMLLTQKSVEQAWIFFTCTHFWIFTVYLALGRAHVTLLLYQLHWLPVRFQVKFKVLQRLTFEALHGIGPDYLNDCLFPGSFPIPPDPIEWACYWICCLGRFIWWATGNPPFLSWHPHLESSPSDEVGLITPKVLKVSQDLVMPVGLGTPEVGWTHERAPLLLTSLYLYFFLFYLHSNFFYSF